MSAINRTELEEFHRYLGEAIARGEVDATCDECLQQFRASRGEPGMKVAGPQESPTHESHPTHEPAESETDRELREGFLRGI